MIREVKLISGRCGLINPCSVQDYLKTGGFEGLRKAVSMAPQMIINELRYSNLMGRGGAGYPAAKKWQQLYEIQNWPKYIVCNGDEGEPGTFKDRYLMENDPLEIAEGMAIAGYVFGSCEGYIYIRGEYEKSQKIMEQAIENAVNANCLGDNIFGSKFSFNIHVVSGAGAYVCGENSALLNSIEGKAGRTRIKPPHLAEVGLFSMPTLVNNVETFACIPYIIEKGGKNYASFGTEDSSGTKLVCLSGNVLNRGVYEVPLGITIREIIYGIGGGIPDDRNIKFIHIGGQSGPCFTEDLIDTPLCFKKLREKGLTLGTGAIVVIDDSNCIVDYAKCTAEFFAHESCGKCTPCREGTAQIVNILKKLSEGNASHDDLMVMERLCSIMEVTSACGLGETATTFLKTCLKYFRNEFEEHINKKCAAGVCNFKMDCPV